MGQMMFRVAENIFGGYFLSPFNKGVITLIPSGRQVVVFFFFVIKMTNLNVVVFKPNAAELSTFGSP